jgi:hypothetical protein
VLIVEVGNEHAVLHHMERYLGLMTVAVRAVRAKDQGGEELPFRLVTYEDETRAPAHTYSTLGLSNHVVEQVGGRLRQEILMCAVGDVRAIEWLNYLGEILLDGNRAFAQGETTPSFGSLSPGSTVTGFAFTAPAYWSDGLGLFEETEPPVTVAWAVPLTSEELAFVGTHGWAAMEMLLIAEDPDLTD